MEINSKELNDLIKKFITTIEYKISIKGNGKISSYAWNPNEEAPSQLEDLITLLEILEVNITCLQFERLKCSTIYNVEESTTSYCSGEEEYSFRYEADITKIIEFLIEKNIMFQYDFEEIVQRLSSQLEK